MRFGKTPDSLIGYGSGLQQPVYVQQQMLASKATPGVPSRYEWVQEVYEQLTLCKYNGQPHTGKNWDRTFTNPRYDLTRQQKQPQQLCTSQCLCPWVRWRGQKWILAGASGAGCICVQSSPKQPGTPAATILHRLQTV
jgi:hypothetical protein